MTCAVNRCVRVMRETLLPGFSRLNSQPAEVAQGKRDCEADDQGGAPNQM